MRRFATLLPALLAAALLAPAAASARVVLVATGDGAATLTDVATNQVAARIPLGGRTRATAPAPDGPRRYGGGGGRVVAIPLSTPRSTGPRARPPPPRTARAATSPRACGWSRST